MSKYKPWLLGLAFAITAAWPQVGAAQQRDVPRGLVSPRLTDNALAQVDNGAPMPEEDASDETSDTTDSSPRAPQAPVDPREIRLHLHDGAVLTGRLMVDSIEVETEFGTLTIPVEQIISLTPGLESRSELFERIRSLIEALGGDDYQAREDSVKALLAMGPPVRGELNLHRGDSNAERKRRVNEILEQLNEQAEELEEMDFFGEPDESIRPWIRLDTVQTNLFTVVGRVSPKEFQVESPYGELAVNLEQIEHLARNVGRAPEIRRTVVVDGGNMVQATWKSSGIRVERGDRIAIRADGQLTMTPWGGNMTSGPDGGGNFGVWRDNINGGTLVARIGSSGDPISVGSRSTFVANRSGVLEFAIAMQNQYSTVQGYNFPGRYTVRIVVQAQD